MNQIDRYIRVTLGCKDFKESDKSNYYRFGNEVIRVSDHIGSCSSGNLSIIIDSNGDRYILHKHSTGLLASITYNEAKKILRSLWTLRKLSIINDANTIGQWFPEDDEKALKVKIDGHNFTKPQLNTIKSFIKQNELKVK